VMVQHLFGAGNDTKIHLCAKLTTSSMAAMFDINLPLAPKGYVTIIVNKI